MSADVPDGKDHGRPPPVSLAGVGPAVTRAWRRESGDRIRVGDMSWKAYHLTESPQLTNAKRTKLRQQMKVSPVSVEEARAEWNAVRPHVRLVTMELTSSAEVERLREVDARYRAMRIVSRASGRSRAEDPSTVLSIGL